VTVVGWDGGLYRGSGAGEAGWLIQRHAQMETRAKAMQKEGLPIAWTYKAVFLVGDRTALLKGAPIAIMRLS